MAQNTPVNLRILGSGTYATDFLSCKMEQPIGILYLFTCGIRDFHKFIQPHATAIDSIWYNGKIRKEGGKATSIANRFHLVDGNDLGPIDLHFFPRSMIKTAFAQHRNRIG